jgi:hypothetical protein
MLSNQLRKGRWILILSNYGVETALSHFGRARNQQFNFLPSALTDPKLQRLSDTCNCFGWRHAQCEVR